MYGTDLACLFDVRMLLGRIVRRDRLPSKNSLEALQLLRNAWNIVDIGVLNAIKYKCLAGWLCEHASCPRG